MKSLATLNSYLIRYRRDLLIGVVWVICTNISMTVAPTFVKQAIDTMSGVYELSTIFKYAALGVLFSALSGISLFAVRQTIIVVSRKVEFDMKNAFYAHLQTLSMNFFKSSSTGDLMSRATNDLNAVRNYFGPGIMYSLNTTFRLTFAVSAMLTMSPKLTLFALLPAPFLSFGVYKLGKLIHERSTELQAKYAEITAKVQENLAGIRIVKAYTREDYETASFQKLNDEYYIKNIALGKLQAVFYPLMTFLLGLSVIFTVWIGGEEVIKNQMTRGEIAQFLIYVAMLSWPMISIGWVTNIIQRAAASQERLLVVMNTKPEIADTDTANHSLNTLRGDIEFRNVSFAYPASPSRMILKTISFTAREGERVAIVGATGSGKSTLVNLIPRLLDATSGEIFIGGHSIKTIPLEVLRKNIGFVPQDYFLFSDTIKNNIAFGVPSASDAAIDDAAKAAAIYDDIQDFPDKMNTMIGERGITLSGGQKQRTSIARALIRKPAILVLDDSLSAVDTKTEDAILRGLQAATSEKRITTLLISHRISTVKDADTILVLDEGEIIERGSHYDLIKQNGLYAELYEKQQLEEELSALE
jgi:ATP-binding cassette, subfamily B, multidrug efflux pump